MMPFPAARDAVLVLCLLLMPPAVSAKDIAGWVEEAVVYPGAIKFNAKVDTGAAHSSVHAQSLSRFTRDGKRWVRFKIAEDAHTIERTVIRIAKIKRHANPPEERPVVRLGICLGRFYKEVDVNLADRSDFDFPLLIGRSFLAGTFVVDPALKNTVAPDCVAHTLSLGR